MPEDSLLTNIIKGCRKQHEKSQEELYRMFYAYGMSITLLYADSRDQAAEILNDAFMKVFEKISTFDTDRPFKPWFRRIVINTAINQFHKDKNRRKWELHEVNGFERGREETITSDISYREIIHLVQQLPPACRTVFNLHVIEGFKHEEIAGLLGIETGTSKSNLARAKSLLRERLEIFLST